MEQIYRSARTVAYRGEGVIVKTPTAPIPDSRELAQYRREYSLLTSWDLPGVVKARELVESGGAVRLVLEDGGGQSLADWMKQRSFTSAEVVEILVQAAEALACVHEHGVVHNDVNPANLVWSPESRRLLLIDFGLASSLAQEKADTEEIKGTLRYLAPEQTGRVNRGVDYRADFYALGATAWHLLVGRAPFESIQDPLALVHAQLARDPPLAHLLKPDIHPSLSAVVATLLAKDPEQRYQSVPGLVADLRRALEEPDQFELKTQDRAVRFAVPDTLYGRERERQLLLDALTEVLRGGRKLVLVAGPAGAGKSTLVAELRGPVVQAHGAFAQGRHELLKRDQPYLALLGALREALRQLLTQSEQELIGWRSRLSTAVGKNSGLLTRLLPELVHLVHELHDVPEVSAEEARNRTHLAVSALVRGLARPTRPLVLFLDDLQWADAASVELLEFLAGDPNVEGLMLVGGHREVDAGSPLGRLLSGLTQALQLDLVPLDRECTRRFVRDTCRAPADELADLLHEKTAGNPFFLKTLLQRLQRDGLLQPQGAGWGWDLEKIRAVEVSENVVDLMVAQLEELPLATYQTLQLAACFGHRFTTAWLAAAGELPAAEVASALWPALERGLVLPLGTDYRLVQFGSQDEAWYRFSHDRVQEAAYHTLEETQRPSLHRKLGQLLLAQGEDSFEVMEHLMRGQGEMHDPAERLQFAELALSAGRRARTAAAFETAFAFFEAGCEALGPQRWQTHYELTRALLTESAHAALAARHHEILVDRLQELVRQSRSFADQIPAWSMQLQFLMHENRMEDAWKLSDDFLRQVGRKQPQSGNLLTVAWSLLRTRWALRGRTPEDLLDLPVTEDPVLKGIQEVQTLAALAQGRVRSRTIPLGILRDVRTVLRDGLTAHGAQCWTGYGLMLCRLGQVPLGMRFGQLAVEQVERLGRPDVWPRVACLNYILVKPWGTPMAEVAPLMRTCAARSLDVGDTWMASYAAVSADGLDYFGGAELSALAPRLERTEVTLSHYRRADTRVAFFYLRRAAQELVRGTGSPPWLGDSRNVDLRADPQGEIMCRGLELQLAMIFGRDELACELSVLDMGCLRSPTLGPLEMIYWTYAPIAALRGVEEGWLTWGPAQRIARQAGKILRRWVRHVPARGYRLDWLEAAQQRARGHTLAALAAYDRAASRARQAGLRQDAALICEQAAHYCRRIGQERVARGYDSEAQALYRQWGALSKVVQTPADLSSGSTGSRILDLETVLRASRLLAGEIRLNILLRDMLNLAMENAGAEKGWMILRFGDRWVLSARAQAGTAIQSLEEPLDLDDPACPLPGALLRYTARTRDPLVHEDALSGIFATDPYVLEQRPRSVLCLPLEHARRLGGLIYLENNRAPGMFTPQRTAVLHTLSGQMAISLENARHFAQVQEQHEQILAERERRHLEELRGQAAEARKDALAAFLGIASHDLKNPLAAIGMWTHQLPPGLVRDHIETACRRAAGLIGTYLDVVAMETGGQLKLNRRWCELGELVEQEIDFALQSLSPEERAGAHLEWDVEPMRCEVDPERLQQVIANLVGNALKYCPAGTPIRVTLRPVEGRAELAVEDQGPGLTPEMQQGLFQPFERRTRELSGSGLGLWICRVIVEAHGGSLGVDSEPGRGSRFWCAL